MSVEVTWKSIIEKNYREPAAEQFRSLKSDDQLIYWCFFYAKSGCFADGNRYGVYFEVFFNSAKNQLYAIGCSFGTLGLSPSLRTLKCQSIEITNDNCVVLKLSADPNTFGESFCSELEISVNLERSEWQLHKIHSVINFEPTWKKSETSVLGEWSETFSDPSSFPAPLQFSPFNCDTNNNDFIEILCPECFGRGEAKSFSIPNEDLKKGYTGYELYSCNKVNSRVACKRCAGHGQIYEEWYLDENPELRMTSSEFILGRGTVQVRRMPFFGFLK